MPKTRPNLARFLLTFGWKMGIRQDPAVILPEACFIAAGSWREAHNTLFFKVDIGQPARTLPLLLCFRRNTPEARSIKID
jgi:hypothetical protein